MDTPDLSEQIKEAVRDRYGGIARRFTGAPAPAGRSSCCGTPPQPAADTRPAGDCCAGSAGAREPAVSAGCCDGPAEDPGECDCAAGRFYSSEELAGLPETVTGASLGCGNPLAIADLRPGEVVLDLGAGGGIDCFLAARKVGPQGRVIGLDMTPDMIKLARRNAKAMGVTNVEFRYGEMEEIPLPDGSVDVILSNCVINLSPDKDAVFGEAYRVLRPGGRLSVSDVVIDGDLPAVVRSRLDAWAGCLAGALDERVYLDKIRAAGFDQVTVLSRDVAGDDELAGAGDMDGGSLAGKVASVKVRASKPG